MHKGLIFDLDGVLVDTAKYHYLAWKAIAEELGIPFTPRDNERLKGVSRARCFEIILEIGCRQMGLEEQAFYCHKKNERYLEFIRQMSASEILPGVRDFIADARLQGYRIALGSASKNSRVVLGHIGLEDAFDAIIDGTTVTKAKPDPEVFLKGAAALCLEAASCIVFEDAVAGIAAAHAAGMAAVGIGMRETLPEADYVIASFEGISIERVEQVLYCRQQYL